jgi:hypothetical protein
MIAIVTPTADDIAAVTTYLDACSLPERTGEYERARDLPAGAPDGTVVFEGTRSDVALWALGRHDPGRTFAVVALPEEAT